MKSFGIYYALLPLILGIINCAAAQDINAAFHPKVFFMGENDGIYSASIKPFNASLLSVSNDSMEIAYMNWMFLLKDIEDYAQKTNFDLNGLKIWLNVFWNKNGRIEVISYYPKPNCRNMEFENLSLFFLNFMKQYKPKLKYSTGFSHYGSARFPSFAEMYIQQK